MIKYKFAPAYPRRESNRSIIYENQYSTLDGPVPTKDIPFSWKMCNVLNRMKNQFSDFYFLNYWENSSKIEVILVQKLTKRIITWKMKIGNTIFLSIQFILYLLCKFYHYAENWIFNVCIPMYAEHCRDYCEIWR